MRRAPRRRQARHECAEHWALNRSHPRSPASRMQIRTGRSSPASALSGATRSAQGRPLESLAARHRPPSHIDPGQAALMHGAAYPGTFLHGDPNKDALFRAAREADRGCIRGSLRKLRSFARRAADAPQHGGRSFPRSFPAVPLTAIPAYSDAPALQLSSGRRSGTPPRLCRQKKTHGMGRPTLDKAGKNIFFVNFYSRKKSFPPSSRFFIFPAISAY